MPPSPSTISTWERRFYVAALAGAALVVFIGFARSYYLKGLFGTPALPALVHVHGAVMTLWFATLIVQARLIATGRADLHRRIGLAAVLLAVAVVVAGSLTAIHGARLGHTPGPPPLAFMAVPLTDMLVFTLLVGTALAWRRRPDVHRRLMLLAGVGMVTAAIGRLQLPGGVVTAASLTVLGVVSCVALDSWRHRRLHPAFAAGALLVIASWPLRLWLAGTPAWQRLAGWLVA